LVKQWSNDSPSALTFAPSEHFRCYFVEVRRIATYCTTSVINFQAKKQHVQIALREPDAYAHESGSESDTDSVYSRSFSELKGLYLLANQCVMLVPDELPAEIVKPVSFILGTINARYNVDYLFVEQLLDDKYLLNTLVEMKVADNQRIFNNVDDFAQRDPQKHQPLKCAKCATAAIVRAYDNRCKYIADCVDLVEALCSHVSRVDIGKSLAMIENDRDEIEKCIPDLDCFSHHRNKTLPQLKERVEMLQAKTKSAPRAAMLKQDDNSVTTET